MTPDFIFLLTQGQTLVDMPLSDGSLIKVPQWKASGAPSLNAWARQRVSVVTPSASTTAPESSLQSLNTAKQIMQSQREAVVGLYSAVVAQAARALGYDSVDAANYHIRKWQGI
jgi:hypothetical protein